MTPISCEELVRRIELYQNTPTVHALTCGNNSLHRNLKPKIIGGVVVLVCEDCDYTQAFIPPLFFTETFDSHLAVMRSPALMKRHVASKSS